MMNKQYYKIKNEEVYIQDKYMPIHERRYYLHKRESRLYYFYKKDKSKMFSAYDIVHLGIKP